jgi:hypothetical protein
MTSLELTDLDAADLAVELYFAGDAETLDAAAALAADLGADLFNYLQEWDDITAEMETQYPGDALRAPKLVFVASGRGVHLVCCLLPHVVEAHAELRLCAPRLLLSSSETGGARPCCRRPNRRHHCLPDMR